MEVFSQRSGDESPITGVIIEHLILFGSDCEHHRRRTHFSLRDWSKSDLDTLTVRYGAL